MTRADVLKSTYLALNMAPRKAELPPYIKFSSSQSFSIHVADYTKYWDGTLEYSYDRITWSVWNGTTTVSAPNGTLYMRGLNNTKITGVSDAYTKGGCNWVFDGDNIECSGNIESLLDYAVVGQSQHPVMGEWCFSGLFMEAPIISSPLLPATELSRGCYQFMFDTSKLITPPVLPAQNLSIECYQYMFGRCGDLTKAPRLPATAINTYSYRGMFVHCVSLEIPPQLLADTVGHGGYASMFIGCKNLVCLPKLPALTVGNSAYEAMFRECSKIYVSENQDGTYINEFRMPTVGLLPETIPSWQITNLMFRDSGGPIGSTFYNATPDLNRTYYTSNELV